MAQEFDSQWKELANASAALVEAATTGFLAATTNDYREVLRDLLERATAFQQWLLVTAANQPADLLRSGLLANNKALRAFRDTLAASSEHDGNTREIVEAIDRCMSLTNGLRQSMAASAPVAFGVGSPIPRPAASSPAPDADSPANVQAPAASAQPFTRVSVLFATDRDAVSDAGPLGLGFTAKRSSTGDLAYGECTVSIPATHKLGQLESPSILRLEFRPDPSRHIVLQTVATLAEEAFLAAVRKRVTESPAKDAFLFVHGYNVSFEDAARRTGQFAFDLGFVGAPILYSWPSNGAVEDYQSDEANVIWTVPHLVRLLSLLNAHSGAERIHLIAHSMGNRAVCDALKALSDKPGAMTLPLLHRLVLAAPDIDADTLRELAAGILSMAGHVTLYASSRDKAIALSARLHKYPRAGGVPLLLLPGFETIDASTIDTDFLAHSYFSSAWPLLADIYEMLSSDKPASGRFALRESSSPAGTWFAFKQ